MKKAILLLFITAALCSCDTTKKVMDSWLGDNKQNLYLKWGPPERITTDASGGEILIYSTQTYSAYLGHSFYHCRMFYAHADGVIYHWRSQDSRVPPQEMNVNLFTY